MDFEAYLLQPDQIEWRDNIATFRGHALGAIVRFYQAEWLATCRTAPFLRHLTSSRTPISNSLTAIIGESKRLPLTWDHLRTAMATWRSLLPETREVHDAPWKTSDEWLLKTALCNTGDTVSIRELMTPRQWRSVCRDAWLRPRKWIVQRRFETIPVSTPLGPLFPCVGVYVVDGRATGAYARLSRGPVVDFAAVDAALLVDDLWEEGSK
jgi:hypothetical protein